MTFTELYALSQDDFFKARCKYALYKAAVAIKKDAGATLPNKALADKVLADKYDIGRVSFLVITEASVSAVASPAAVTDANILTAITAVVPVLPA